MIEEITADTAVEGVAAVDAVDIVDILVAGRGQFSSEEVALNFYPAGWVDKSVIHFKSEDGKMLSLEIQPLTGLTKAEHGYKNLQ